MTSHQILILWSFVYIILLSLCLGLFLQFEAIRIRIAILLICLILSFIFYPIYILDKRNSARIIKAQKSKKSKILTSGTNKLEKNKEELVIPEQGLKTQDNTEKKIDITCEFCGKKIDEDVKLCPYCGTKL
jgi:hypothetical protein